MNKPQAKILTVEELEHHRIRLPESWTRAAGLLKGKKRINGLTYQKQVRKEWDKRLKKLVQA